MAHTIIQSEANTKANEFLFRRRSRPYVFAGSLAHCAPPTQTPQPCTYAQAYINVAAHPKGRHP
jgi:hypothetical protein